ncbi:vanadium-dependent haloperoxidase [Paenibacillus sp. GP183]|jgi:membrane-associated phospholipid phosphatase|uniref:vanadium-dependent haloperoxidase n=1 Tax=Paenibacillus sp. GP183 TaxID=1882751 RepID=UPI000895BA96|nr:vanadium-dependent haloperoxidase [Paenibacillus sp. GP183]SEB57758.1 PAP2 superfamily protein [Paenibacillus sp. GP183]
MRFMYPRWSKLPYAGEKKPPTNPIDPLAGSWSTNYIRLDRKGTIRDRSGRRVKLFIQHPTSIKWNEQLKIVQKTLKKLTKHQIRVAKYWGTGVATKQFTPIIDRLIDTYGITPVRAARILAAVQAGINDTFVVTWFYKYLWDVARPNQLDRNLATVLCTPRFPAYVSGHSAAAGCAQVILSYFFPGESKRLKQLAEECAISRLYAGVHFPVDNEEGLSLGRQIGKIVVAQLRKERNSKSQPIDVPIRENRNAKLPPPPYIQVIPFRFDERCQSTVRKNHSRKKTAI